MIKILISLIISMNTLASEYVDLEVTNSSQIAGVIRLKLDPEIAPQHVSRFKELVESGFYNGTVFHRVIDGFVVQGGDPKGNGTGGSGQKLKAEFNKKSHLRGVLSMARSQDINSADSQFFIMLADTPYLDGQYTAFGEVVSGMEFVDGIKKGDPNKGGVVSEPRDYIIKASVVK